MNKKFSTLMAGLLLAGGAFSNAWATDINTLANTGKYYKIVRTGYKAADGWKSEKTSSYYLGENALVEGVANADFWRVEKASNGTITLVNFSGKTLQVDKKNVSISTIRYNDTDLAKEENPVETNLFVTADNKYLGNTDKNGTSWPLVLTDTKSVSNSSSINAWDVVDAGNTGDVLGFRTELGAGAIDAIRFIYNNNGIYTTTDIYQVAYDKTTETYSFKHNHTGDEVVAGSVKSFKLCVSPLHGAYLMDASGSKYVKLTITNGVIELADLVDNEVEATYLGFEITKERVPVTVGVLNYYEKDGFSVEITCAKDADGEFDDALKGDMFVGHLTPMTFNWTEIGGNNKEGKFEPASDGTREFYLKNADGQYIVAVPYNVEVKDPRESLYHFTTVSEAELQHNLRRAWQGLEDQKYFGRFRVSVDEAALAQDPTKLDEITWLEVNVAYFAPVATDEYATVGRADIDKVPTLVAACDGYYVGTTLKDVHIQLGSGQVVDWKELLQPKFFTVEKYTDGTLVGELTTSSVWDTEFRKTKAGNELENQFALTIGNRTVKVNGKETTYVAYVFANRETPTSEWFEIPVSSLYYTDKDFTYKYGSDIYVIKPVAEVKDNDGYERYDKSDLNRQFNIAYSSDVFGSVAYLAENHDDAKDAQYHAIGLKTDKADALVFNIKGYTEERKFNDEQADHSFDYHPTDSIYVISNLGFYNAKTKEYDTKQDTLKIIAYTFVNQFNEPLQGLKQTDATTVEGLAYVSKVYADDTKKEKYESADKAHEVATKFVIRKDNGKYNLRPIFSWKKQFNETEYNKVNGKTSKDLYQEFSLYPEGYSEIANYCKLYAGDAATGLINDVNMYQRTENDLFDIEVTTLDVYRRLAQNVDTVSIFRDANANEKLYENTTEIAEKVFVNFLGLGNIAQMKDMAPAMLADTAYVRCNTYKPQYMLIVDPTIHPAGQYCEEHDSYDCEHGVPFNAWTEGRILVNLVDSANAWDAAHKHQVGNPYKKEGYNKLGFINATHRRDSLIVDGKRQFIGNNDDHIAKFQFRYVDTESKSFVIETKGGYLKNLGGDLVVVSDINSADVFNMTEGFEGDPTANENITAGNVVVAGVNGAVVVKGAEGKNVIVSTILGKVVANEVVSSDNAQISAPAGIVVVSVDGESFKVVVK